MKQRHKNPPIILFLILLTAVQLRAFRTTNRTIRPSLGVGIGYPKISLSQFRPPISVAGNTGIHWSVTNKWALEATGYGLKTFSLGTVTDQKATLKFDAWWVGLDLQYQLLGDFNNTNYLCAGLGRYHLYRRLDTEIDRLYTPGLCLGYVSHLSHLKRSSVIEVRWHLLFEPDDQPQILTLTFGILL